MADTSLIQQIRTASRLMVRELGFMNTTLAATHYSPSAVHTLLEVSVRGAMTAAQLVALLGLEKSSVSRMGARLLGAGGLGGSPCAAGWLLYTSDAADHPTCRCLGGCPDN